ncbi:hypothetical protein [Myroides sp. WP-1]|uniref:hypothetical protein n=1 Tax=Myroides sp. WP-1 TaxID=2759944 RepID=UPI0015F7C2C8|nr:hypothetical protein [Myroides sp. WP-1]MBB1139817.1 hypothetical protein [Myroides sp. WP-1]
MKIFTTLLLVLWGAVLLGVSSVYGQAKAYQAQLAPVMESGYYNIELDNRLVGCAKDNFSNLRIVQQDTADTMEIPYFIRAVQPSSKETKMIDYPIFQRIEKDSINRFVVHNPEKREIKDFYVTINKADVVITASVRGSNNGEDWFSVKQKQPIYTDQTSSGGEATLFIGMPEGHYPYYEIELVNNQATPLKLNKVSTVVDTHTYGQFSPILLQYDAKLTQQKNKTTLVSFIRQPQYYKLNKVSVAIDNPQDYYRKAMLRDSITKVAIPLTLSSKGSNEFIVEHVVVQNPYIEIYNGNNPPIVIKDVVLSALTRFATAYLHAGKTYDVIVNNEITEIPEYDIQHFKNEIPLLLPTVKTIDFTSSELATAKERSSETAGNMNTLLWVVLSVVGLLVVYICYQTFKKLGK